jgi:Tfp pilus assembly protein PilF
MALFELTAGDRAKAASLFAVALSLDPTSESARLGLAQATAAEHRR